MNLCDYVLEVTYCSQAENFIEQILLLIYMIMTGSDYYCCSDDIFAILIITDKKSGQY